MAVDVYFYPIIDLENLEKDNLIKVDEEDYIVYKDKRILYTYGSDILRYARYFPSEELFEFQSLLWSKYRIVSGIDGAIEDAGYAAMQEAHGYGDITINGSTPYDILVYTLFPKEMLIYLKEYLTEEDIEALEKNIKAYENSYQELMKTEKYQHGFVVNEEPEINNNCSTIELEETEEDLPF